MTQEIDLLSGKIKMKCRELEELQEFVSEIERGLGRYQEIEKNLGDNVRKTE